MLRDERRFNGSKLMHRSEPLYACAATRKPVTVRAAAN